MTGTREEIARAICGIDGCDSDGGKCSKDCRVGGVARDFGAAARVLALYASHTRVSPEARARQLVEGHAAAYGAIPRRDILMQEIAHVLAFVEFASIPHRDEPRHSPT